MFDVQKLHDDLLALEAAVLSPSVSGIARAAATVELDLADAWDMFGPLVVERPAMKATPQSAECKELCARITAHCQAPRTFAADPVGKLGDGTFLKALLANLPAILAFISTFL